MLSTTNRQTVSDLDPLIIDKRNKAMSSGESLAVEDLKERLGWRNDAIRTLGSFLYRVIPLFRKAIDTIVTFAKSVYNVFDGDEASTVKDTIEALTSNDNDKASIVNFLLVTADHRANLTAEQFRKAQREVEKNIEVAESVLSAKDLNMITDAIDRHWDFINDQITKSFKGEKTIIKNIED